MTCYGWHYPRDTDTPLAFGEADRGRIVKRVVLPPGYGYTDTPLAFGEADGGAVGFGHQRARRDAERGGGVEEARAVDVERKAAVAREGGHSCHVG